MLRYEIFLHLRHLAPTFHATLWDLLSHLHPRFMLHYEILSCTCTILHPRFMLRYEIFSCTCPHVSCYAMRSSLALALGTRDPKDRRVAKHLFDTVKSFMFRHNCGCQLWSQLGKLAKENVWNNILYRWPSKYMEKYSQNRKKVCRLAPAMRISNRNFDTRDKNAVNTRIRLLSRWRKGGFSLGSLTTP